MDIMHNIRTVHDPGNIFLPTGDSKPLTPRPEAHTHTHACYCVNGSLNTVKVSTDSLKRPSVPQICDAFRFQTVCRLLNSRDPPSLYEYNHPPHPRGNQFITVSCSSRPPSCFSLFLQIPAACHSHHPALITCALMCLLWSPEFVKTIFTNTAQPLLDFFIRIFAIRPLEIFGLHKIRPKPSPKCAKQTLCFRNGDISPQVSFVQQQQRGFYRFFFS